MVGNSTPQPSALSPLDPSSPHSSNRQIRILPAHHTTPIDRSTDIRSDNGDIARETRYRAQEVAKEDHDAVELDAEPDQRPAHQDQQEAEEKRRRAFGLLFAREEGDGFGGADYCG